MSLAISFIQFCVDSFGRQVDAECRSVWNGLEDFKVNKWPSERWRGAWHCWPSLESASGNRIFIRLWRGKWENDLGEMLFSRFVSLFVLPFPTWNFRSIPCGTAEKVEVKMMAIVWDLVDYRPVILKKKWNFYDKNRWPSTCFLFDSDVYSPEFFIVTNLTRRN